MTDRRLLMCVDMESYSARNDMGQIHAQKRFPEIMREAAKLCGLDRHEWEIQPTGDGELAIFDSGVSEPKVVAELVAALDRVVRDHNRQAADHAQIRLRVALHQGLINRTSNGYAGGAVVKVARLVDAKPLRAALETFPKAGAGLIVSAEIYRDVVCQSYSGIREDRFKKVRVEVKSFVEDAWIFVPDEDVNGGSGPGGPPPTPPAPTTAGGSKFSFGTVTTHGPTAFGDHTTFNGLQR